MKAIRKVLTLSDGSKITLRKLSQMDFIKAGAKTIPDLVGDGRKAQGVSNTPAANRTNADFYLVFIQAIVVSNPKIIDAQGKRWKLVDDDKDDLADNEVTINDLPEKDIEAIISASVELNGEVGAKASKFPEQEDQSSSPAPAGEDVQLPPVVVAEGAD